MGNSVLLLGLRHLRAPLITLVTIFAAGVAGLVLIPGTDAQGDAWHMTFTQALYFVSYTATTIGFGEIPQAFTEVQRLWVTGVIFASVVGWAFLVASLLGLVRDVAFRGAVTAARFARDIRAIREPFYLICGFGETGHLVGRALDRLGYRFVVIDIDPLRVQELALMDFVQDTPGLATDARLPRQLQAAGLTGPWCRGVLALTSDDQANLAVAMAVRLLNPATPVLARAMSREVAANMASFGTDHIINPFARFGAHLAQALSAPDTDRLISWLTALPGSAFEPRARPPRGHWVVCGYGRFGREVVAALRDQGLDVSVIDTGERPIAGLRSIRGTGTEAEPLLAAGIRESVGIVAGTDDDIANLSIAVTARELNADLFVVVRQNLQANGPLFEAFAADVTMISSEVIANECLAVIQTPRLADFLALARRESVDWSAGAVERLGAVLGARAPEVWSVTVDAATTPALVQALSSGTKIELGTLARNPRDRHQPLPIIALGLYRRGRLATFPDPAERLQSGDEVLYAGVMRMRDEQALLLRNGNVFDYVLTGREAPGGWLWSRLPRRCPTSSTN